MPQDAEQERTWWDDRSRTFAAAQESIAADPAAWRGEVLEKCLAQILPALSGVRGRVLDLGCGAGRLTIPVAQRLGVHLVGVDISEGMLARAKERTPPGLTIDWVLGDGRTLPDVGPLAGAFSMITLQHVPREVQADYIAQVAAQLTPGGVFRFQLYKGSDDVFLMHHVDETWAAAACAQADLELQALELVAPYVDAAGAALWITAVKPAKTAPPKPPPKPSESPPEPKPPKPPKPEPAKKPAAKKKAASKKR